jgi:hypothetical protein
VLGPPVGRFGPSCNDLLARPDGYLLPDDSVVALDLGWQTVGTADVPNPVIHAWIADVLANPDWGVIRCAKLTARGLRGKPRRAAHPSRHPLMA